MTTLPFASFTLVEYWVGILWMNCQIFQKTHRCIERICGSHSLDELSNTSEKHRVALRDHIFSAFPAPQVTMTPAMVLEPATTDMETLFLRFYTISTQIWKYCFYTSIPFLHRYGSIVFALLLVPHAVICSGKAYFTLFVHIVVIYLLARMWSKNHKTPGGGFNLSEMELQIKSVTTEVNNLTGPLKFTKNRTNFIV